MEKTMRHFNVQTINNVDWVFKEKESGTEERVAGHAIVTLIHQTTIHFMFKKDKRNTDISLQSF